MKERIDAAPFVVETGAQPGRIMIYLGLTSDGLLLDQHSWQAKMGAPGCRDATESSGQTAPRNPLRYLIQSGTEWLVGGRCG